MKSRTFITFEMNNPVIAVTELKQQIDQQITLLKNSAGLLFCYSDMDVPLLVDELWKRLNIPIIGATAIAALNDTKNFHDMSVTLMILTADDCEFSVSVSEPINPRNIRIETDRTYRKAASSLSGGPKLVYAIPPYQLDIMLDAYTDVFTEIAPEVPFIGGLPSCNGSDDDNLTICNGGTYPDRLVMLAVSGRIRPVFSLQTVLESNETKKRRVTQAKNNVIYKVDDISFTDYLLEIGMPLKTISDFNKTVSFAANPLLIEDTREGFGPDFKYLRTLHEIDMADGSGTAIGRVPLGSYVSVHPLSRGEIGEAARIGIQTLNRKMLSESTDGYEFSTVLAVSCTGRYVIMTPNGEVETVNVLKGLRDGLNLAGFYSYGEISPLPVPGGLVSFSHNESLVLCAF